MGKARWNGEAVFTKVTNDLVFIPVIWLYVFQFVGVLPRSTSIKEDGGRLRTRWDGDGELSVVQSGFIWLSLYTLKCTLGYNDDGSFRVRGFRLSC